jgi:hypothetical protein
VENETTRISLSGAALTGVALGDLLSPVMPNRPASYTTAPLDLERNRRDMYTTQWSLGVQQSLGNQYVAEAAYLGSKGSQLFTRTYYNTVNAATGARPYTQFGLIPVRANGSNSSYHSALFALRRQPRAGLSLNANYMLSHAIDEYSAGGDDVGYPENVACRRCERASSDFDIRHVFNVNAVYELPFGRGRRYLRSGVLSAIAGGWEWAGIATARTGKPVTITVSRAAAALPDQNVTSTQRPDVVPGVSVKPAAQTMSGWLNLAAFSVPAAGKWGNAGRNLATSPALWSIDSALTRRQPVWERATLEFRFEVFNLLNHPQLGVPAASISAPATFGRITQPINTGATGSGTPRQMEFAMRLSF